MKKINFKALGGMQVFTLIWFGQFVSVMGTAMTRFGLLIWAYDQVGKASTVALLGFYSYVPYILLSPLAGIVVDKFDRKIIMILADLGAGLMTVGMLVLYITGNLQIWHLYLGEALAASFEAFQVPAYSSSITLLIPKDKYTKASGMRSFSRWASQVLAPVLGGFLIVQIGISGVMVIDIATFLIAVTTLCFVFVPNPDFNKNAKAKGENIWREMLGGLDYFRRRRGLLYLMILYVGINFLASVTYFGILSPMVLARTGSNKMALAVVQAALGIGGVVGSAIVSLWGDIRKKILTISITGAASFLLGDIFLGIGSNFHIWAAAAFLSSFFLPFLIGANTSLWQSKVDPGVQGRVFSLRDVLQTACMPVGFILGGVLADNVFEPAMSAGGSLNRAFGWLVGTGSGSGMALMFLMTGTLGTILCLGGYALKELRNLEENLPDYDMIEAGMGE